MAARLQLRVVRTVLGSIETLLRELWPLLRIYVVPWLGWSLAIIALDRYWIDRFETGVSPEVIVALTFAPFGALITVGALRWLIEPREGFALFRFDETLAWVTGLFGLMGLASYVIEQATFAWQMPNPELIVAGSQADSSPGQRLVWLIVAILPGWIATLLVYLLLMGQAIVIVERGAPSLERQWQVMRLAPLSILGVAGLIGICRLGFGFGYGSVLLDLVTWDGPLPGLAFGWRRDLAIGLWRALILLPAHFLTDALVLVALARVYRVLAGYLEQKGVALPKDA